MVFLSGFAGLLASIVPERKHQLEADHQTTQKDEDRLNQVLEESHFGFWDMNIETDDIFFSSHWAEILDYSPEEITPDFKTWKKLVHPSDLPRAIHLLNEHLEGHTPRYEAEYRILKKSGDWKWILVRGQVVTWNEKGNPLRVLGSVVDITERKQTELSLRKSEQRYRAIINDQTELICRFLPDCTLTFVNDACYRYFNKTNEELVGHSFIPSIPEEDHTLFWHHMALINSGTPLVTVEHRVIMSGGEIRWLQWTNRAIFGHDGNIVEFQSVGRDITERKQAEEALRWSEECFRKVFNTSQNLISICSLTNNTYIDVNESWVQHTGYTREEALGRTDRELNLIADLDRFEDLIKIFLEQKTLDNIELRYRTKLGQIRLALCSANLLDITGKECVLVILTDITEHRLLEKKITWLDRLHLVGEMAASIAHEIRNPMTTVRGFLQLFEERDYSPEDRDSFQLMIKELDRANSIISEYLSLAKNKEPNLVSESLNNILNSLHPLMLAEAVMSDKSVILELGSIPQLLLDHNEIRQVILNLTRNGLEATPPGGRIFIRTFIDGAEVVLSVEDQGPGINPELIENLGVPFFTTKEHGTGLGLAVCYGIAMRHKATIDVKTDPTGTTFLVRFKQTI